MSKRNQTVIFLAMVVIMLFSGCKNQTILVEEKTSTTQEKTTVIQTEQETYPIPTIKNQDNLTTKEYKEQSIVISDYLYDHPIKGWVYIASKEYSVDNISKQIGVISGQEKINIIGEYEDKFIVSYNNSEVLVRSKNIIEIFDYQRYNNEQLLEQNIIGKSKTVSTSTSLGRANNLEISSNELNVIIPSGRAFSFNSIVGPRTSTRGYQKASIIENGAYVQGYGGGVCQTSTTVHIAVLNAISNGYSFNVTERHDHQLPVEYASRGEEAAIYWGSCDQRWINKNDFDVAIKIWSENQTVYVELYKL